jgi:hypothetical protein
MVMRGRKLAGFRLQQPQGEILQEKSHPQGGDDRGDPGGLAQGTVGQPLDGHPQERGEDHAEQQGAGEDQHQGQTQGQPQQEGGPGQAEVGAHHEDVAVGEVDHGEDAVHHGVAQGDEGVNAPQLQGVQDVLGQDLQHYYGLLFSVFGFRFRKTNNSIMIWASVGHFERSHGRHPRGFNRKPKTENRKQKTVFTAARWRSI